VCAIRSISSPSLFKPTPGLILSRTCRRYFWGRTFNIIVPEHWESIAISACNKQNNGISIYYFWIFCCVFFTLFIWYNAREHFIEAGTSCVLCCYCCYLVQVCMHVRTHAWMHTHTQTHTHTEISGQRELSEGSLLSKKRHIIQPEYFSLSYVWSNFKRTHDLDEYLFYLKSQYRL